MSKSEFKHIIQANNGIFYKICRAYTSNQQDFEDLYQEVLVQLWSSFSTFKGKSSLSTWIYRVALNTALSFRKKLGKASFINLSGSELPEPAEDPYNEEHINEKIELLYRCIQQLKPDEKALILLHLEEKKYEEISEIMGITTSNVGVKLKRTREKLHSLLKKYDYERI